jgi:hypothetical protein
VRMELMEAIMIYRHVLFLCVSVSFIKNSEAFHSVSHEAHNYVLHQLLYVWEDMRVLTHAAVHTGKGFCFFDAIADQIMRIHDLVTYVRLDSDDDSMVALWTECMNHVMSIIQDVSLFIGEYNSSESAMQLYRHVQQLSAAIGEELNGLKIPYNINADLAIYH